MRFITAAVVSASLALGQDFSLKSSCDDLINAGALSPSLPSTVPWKLQARECTAQPENCRTPLAIQENRIRAGKPLPHKTDDADAFWGQFGYGNVAMRPYKGVVLEKYNCSLLQGFVCGSGFDGQYCNLMFAQKAGCESYDDYKNSPEHSSKCREISEKFEDNLEREHFVMQCSGASAQPVVTWSQ
ncbi:hypothetical protein MHUMG1_01378 [Metarhizium humberi]|uniref:Uncharacterized protein n=1 Tax=Metarhizium humberi TaxID=2596975 RepID=A0A9P8MHG8_9HYPO|nr:hypothetical protein MHUMG1_01378 [Metarhizium humberi]